MVARTSFGDLERSFARLQQALEMLHWAAVQAQPHVEQRPALLDHYDTAAEDLLGLAHGGHRAVDAARQAGGYRLDMHRAAEALSAASHVYNRLWALLYETFGSPERLADLQDLSGSGPTWRVWVEGLSDALAPCPSCLYEVGEALAGSWQNVLDGVSLPPLTVQVVEPLADRSPAAELEAEDDVRSSN
jgi:hypothetical protein